MRHITLDITTIADGSATVNGPAQLPASRPGFVYAILYQPGTIATGATITVTSQGRFAKPLLTKANAGTADALYYPRDLSHKVADGSALTDQITLPLFDGAFRVVVASGGNGGKGSVTLYYFHST